MSILITSVLNCASYRLAISLLLSCIFFWSLDLFFHLGYIYIYDLSQCACYVVRGGALGIGQVGANYVAALWCCMWRRGPRGNNAACLALRCFSVTSSATHKQIVSFWCWFLGGWFSVHSRTLWVSPMNSPLMLGVSPTASTLSGFFSEDLRLYFLALDPWVVWSILLPSCSSWFIWTQMWDSPVFLLPPCCNCSPPRCPTPPFLMVWMNVSSLTP